VRQPDPRNVRDALLSAGYSDAETERMLRAVRPGTLIDDHAATLIGARDNLNADYIDENYGNFMGGDPRDFRPDPECSTPEERERHRLACEAAERGDVFAQDLPPGSGIVTMDDGTSALGQRADVFGLGTTSLVDVDRECLIHNVERMVEMLDKEFTATSLPPLEITEDEARGLRLSSAAPPQPNGPTDAARRE
jgi:hypothetical protein